MKKSILVFAIIFVLLGSILVFANPYDCSKLQGSSPLVNDFVTGTLKRMATSDDMRRYKPMIQNTEQCKSQIREFCGFHSKSNCVNPRGVNFVYNTKCSFSGCGNTCDGSTMPGLPASGSNRRCLKGLHGAKYGLAGCVDNQGCGDKPASGLAGMTGFITWNETIQGLDGYLENMSNGACPYAFNLTDISIDDQVKGDAVQLHYYEAPFILLGNVTDNITNTSYQAGAIYYRFCQSINLTHIGAAINWTGIDVSWKDECVYSYDEGNWTSMLGQKDFANSSDNNGFTGIDAELPLEIIANQTESKVLIIRCNVTHNWTSNETVIFIGGTGPHGVGNTIFNESEASASGLPTGEFEGPLEPVPEFSTNAIIILVILVGGLIATIYYIRNKK